jgi:hypothetical protein
MAEQRFSRPPVSVYALAGVRLFNGITGLLAPVLLIRRLDPDREPPVRRLSTPSGSLVSVPSCSGSTC